MVGVRRGKGASPLGGRHAGLHNQKFGAVNRYDLPKEFPIMTLRRTALKSATDEMLWIWQQKSNNIHDPHSHIWDEWADEKGSIGKAYGYQMGVKHQYK